MLDSFTYAPSKPYPGKLRENKQTNNNNKKIQTLSSSARLI